MNITIYPKIATNEHELKQALDSNATVIYIQPPLYATIVNKVKRSSNAKIMKGTGLTALLLGFFLINGPLAWFFFLGGAATNALGRSMDSLKDYKVKVDEMRNRIELYRKTGETRYNPSKHKVYHKES